MFRDPPRAIITAMLLDKTIRLFLDGIGRREEYEFYLEKFRSAGGRCFALLVPEPRLIGEAGEMLAFDLHFLTRLELMPALLLAGPGAEEAWSRLEGHGEPPFRRVGDPAQFDAVAAEGLIPVFVREEAGMEEAIGETLTSSATRIHFLRSAGGLRDAGGREILYLYTARENGVQVSESDQPAARTATELLERRPDLHISFTSPIHLLPEIFTVRGAGTVVRRGSVIVRHEGLEGVDRARLAALLEQSFGRPLRDPAILDQCAECYLEQDYRGAVVLETLPEGCYLSKFAVGAEARGEGIAQELWREVRRSHAALFWRSHRGNPVNQWYDRLADGRHAVEKWRVYWIGFDAERIPGLIRRATDRPPDFMEDTAAG
ncbi:acetylglutamate kinase [Kiritimatiella glycovorans]|uniref:Acetylglutamate kinase n=1 Tax=Kiritimatiella glycovorans TaxID=1307763 RepID=A0A0G3EHV9_9BACT|nr:acetylglutamate kinase [Kiritimatiella glycovorans]